MKKIILLLSIIFLTISCSVDDNRVDVHYEALPIESVDIPDSFTLGETHPITVRYFRPSTCHAFSGFYYEKDLNIRTIGVQTRVLEVSNCEELTDELVEEILYFYVSSNGSYVFKFWKGKDAQGEDMFLEIEVPVN
uniref:hypothetical protein n=1 Tax=Flavobacterium sp. TaxID=239 RepID=UPI00404B3423